jgi:pimeloyl-ACP methyl ester carboxylesterase
LRVSSRTLAFVCVLATVALNVANIARAAAQSPSEGLRWTACPDVADTQCAGLSVPVDPGRPNGARFTLRLARVPASDPSHKRGMLLFIPGGPGLGIPETIGGDTRKVEHVEDFRKSYDVVTFDPRGVGKSNPILCAPNAVPPPEAPLVLPPSVSYYDATARANAALFRSCFAETGELMSHLSAMDTAADIEAIRKALTPNAGLVAYAGSYGTEYAQAYLERYGQHVQALVLDAVVDHSVDLPTFMTRTVLSVNDTFEQFAIWCRSDAACALHNKSVGAVYDAAVAKVPETRKVASQLLAVGLDPEFGWPAIAKMLADVDAGQTDALKALTATASIASRAEDPRIRAGKNGLFPGVICSDYGPQTDYAQLVAEGNAIAKLAPRFAWKFWDAAPIPHATVGVGDCVAWPKPASYPPHRLNVGTHPNVMVASPTHDPATPLANALSVWLQIPQARLLVADVGGHQSLTLSACAYKAQARFLENPKSVSSVTVCPN